MTRSVHGEFPNLGPTLTVERELGGGGMSRVFVAREHALDRDVVVKVLSLELSGSLSAARFAREIRFAAALQEPHIVPVHSSGTTAEGLPYYTMPFIRGESLRSRLSAGKLPIAESLGILRDIARALRYAHDAGVIHRDIKPENILLSSGSAMVTDFGIAKAITVARQGGDASSNAGSVLTSMGMSIGTPAYMSPEQAAGDTDTDHRADIYAWGVVAWEILGGRHPFSGATTPQRLIAAHISEAPPPLADVPAPIAKLVMRCLAKHPEMRPGSAAELEGELTAADRVAAPRHISRRVMTFAGMGIVVLMLAIGAMMWRGRSDPMGAQATRSIGVVLFTNLSAERENQSFSDGMTQEIADALGRIPGLRVAFHRPLENAPLLKPLDLARALGVQTLLQGAVQRSGNRIRVSAHLVNGNDGLQLWSGKFDRQASDVFELQDEVARAIASELKLTLAMGSGASFARVSTKDPEAHNLYLEGMYLLQRRGARNIYRSITLFERALERDPRFARAWAGIALADAIVITWDDVNADTMLARSVDAAQKALAIDSTTSEAWTALGEATGARWQYDDAVPAFERAIELDPNNATAHQWYAEMLARLGRFDEARAHLATALQLAPLSPVVNTQVGRVELQARNFDKAEGALRNVLRLDSTYGTAHTLLGAIHLQRRDYDRAIEEFRKSLSFAGTRRSLNLGFLGHAYALAGQPDSARVILRELQVRRAGGENVMHASLALIYDALGDRARALAQLDTAVAKYDAVIQMHGREAIFDPLRRDARGAVLLARAGDLRPGARQQP